MPAETEQIQNARKLVSEFIRNASSEWESLSHDIHAHPELAFQEEYASARISELLTRQGIATTNGLCGMKTALRSDVGTGDFTVALCAEYDALPMIGHACGHNMIAGAAVAAFCGLAQVADELDITVRLLGTPAEESGGGKVAMVRDGAFDGADVAMMVHPAPYSDPTPKLIAASHFGFEFRGQSSHAAAAPELGVNAADAAVLAQNAIGLLRQQLPAGVLVHGVVEGSGDAPNVIPERAWGRYILRAATMADLVEVSGRVRACFEGAATATGCQVEFSEDTPAYPEVKHARAIAAVFEENARGLGVDFHEMEQSTDFAASTDFGAVSHLLPSIHPHLKICAPDVANHQQAFTEASVGDEADRMMITGAVALALTAIDVATHPSLLLG